jgi:hypothetical protein
VNGTSATAHNGQVDISYTNSDGDLVLTSSGNLHIYKVHGCAGALMNGDAATLSGTYAVNPQQTVAAAPPTKVVVEGPVTIGQTNVIETKAGVLPGKPPFTWSVNDFNWKNPPGQPAGVEVEAAGKIVKGIPQNNRVEIIPPDTGWPGPAKDYTVAGDYTDANGMKVTVEIVIKVKK